MLSLLRKSSLTVSETFLDQWKDWWKIYIYIEIMLSRLKYISVANMVIGPFLQQ